MHIKFLQVMLLRNRWCSMTAAPWPPPGVHGPTTEMMCGAPPAKQLAWLRSRPLLTKWSLCWKRRKTRSSWCSTLWSSKAKGFLGGPSSSRFKWMMTSCTFKCLKAFHRRTSQWPWPATRSTKADKTKWCASSPDFAQSPSPTWVSPLQTCLGPQAVPLGVEVRPTSRVSLFLAFIVFIFSPSNKWS